MKLTLVVLISFTIFVLSACEQATEKSSTKFPEISLQAGSDSDSSSISLRTIRQPNGELLAQVSRWGIKETGLSLTWSTENRILTMYIMGRCGTISTCTWVKEVFNRNFSTIEEDTLVELRFTNSRDTLFVSKQK